MISPNDADPPDYVTGEGPMEGLFEEVYKKFPWLGEIAELRYRDVVTFDFGKRGDETINDMIEFVMEKACSQGAQDAGNDAGEYIHTLEMKAAIVPNAEQVLGAVRQCQGICLDSENWEFLYVARKVCTLFGVNFPKEWDPKIQQKER